MLWRRLGLITILGMAAALRLWWIDRLPPGFHFDESFEGLEAWRILTEPGYRPIFLTGNFGVPPLNAYANALTFALARLVGGEAGPTAMRVTAAVFGVLGVGVLYALAAELRRTGGVQGRLSGFFPLGAAAVLAMMRWHIHFSRMGIEPILVPLIWAGATALLLHGWRTGRWWAFVGCGIALAAGMYAYQGAWIIPFLTALTVAHLWLAAGRPAPVHRIPGVAVAALTAALLVAPLGWFFWQNPELLLLRPTQVAIVGATGGSAPGAGDNTLPHNLWATARMFGPFGQPGDLDPRRNLPGAPALNLWLAAPFYLGLLLSLVRIRQPAFAVPLLGLVGLLLPGVITEYAPHFHRVLGASAPAALLCAVGLDAIWQWGSRWQEGRWRQRLASLTVAALLLAGGVTSAYNYFVRWASLPDLFYAFDQGLWEVGQRMAALPPDAPLYISPRGQEHPTLAFAWQVGTGEEAPRPVSFDGRHIFPLRLAPNPQAERYVVILPEDFRTPLLLPEVFPTAQVEAEILDTTGQPYARFYRRPVDARPARLPRQPLVQELGDGIALVGYDVLPELPQAGGILYLQLHWQVQDEPTQDWTVFTHVVNLADGTVVAGHDSRPGAGSLPTVRWQRGWRILDEYQIPLPADLPAGDYGLRIGLYRPTGDRLPAEGAGAFLGTVSVEGSAE
ncbi:MAG: hypothetical protein KatS3mg050_0440 [Litorilinea sp.]|nr:MAG: hypothetical protein KatS3mg050_0440 [Litorilinea sp.]